MLLRAFWQFFDTSSTSILNMVSTLYGKKKKETCDVMDHTELYPNFQIGKGTRPPTNFSFLEKNAVGCRLFKILMYAAL